MKSKFLNFGAVIIMLTVLTLGVPVEAKTVKTTKVKKIAVVNKGKKISLKSNKKTKLVGKSVVHKTVTPAFSATEAAHSVSYGSGKTPPPGYMEALKKAEDDLFAAKAKAHGNREKIAAAEAAYDQALNEAQQMLN